MNRKWSIIVFMLLFIITATGCGAGSDGQPSAGSPSGTEAAAGTEASAAESAPAESAPAESEPGAAASVEHEWGTYQSETVPERIVTLDFSFIDTLTSLGVKPVGNAGVGTTKIPEYLQDRVTEADAADVGERKAPNLEVVQSLKPDLIIASVDRHSMIRGELEGIAPTVAFDDVSYDEVLDNVRSIAAILGKQEEAEQVVAGLNEKIAAVKQRIEGAPTILVAGLFDDTFTVWVKDSFVGSLLSQVGADYAFNGEKDNLEGKGEGVHMTLERLHEINPDYIMLYGDSPDKLQSNPLYQDLKSVKDGRFIVVDRNLWARGRGPIAANEILDETLAALAADSASE
ncbi:ABC transporter substrate-binding protein [Cohnella cellulosilytica]|uniref:ABC transporter substrate-binding protein n=1 Tax=Cohnella cellulosilytica TaxID=986710 RepID=A0ABW2F359_9BACL